jgi:hypothetical protein
MAIAALFDMIHVLCLFVGFCIVAYRRLQPVAAQVSAVFIAYAATDGKVAVQWYKARGVEAAKLCRMGWRNRKRIARMALSGCDRVVAIALQVG